jgi:hypothetical protein
LRKCSHQWRLSTTGDDFETSQVYLAIWRHGP